MRTSVGIVIPVYNEESRLDFTYFGNFSKFANVRFVFVDDGSIDNTESIIQEFIKENSNFFLIRLSENVGKANAIRAGWKHLNEIGDFSTLGFLDGDGAFSLDDIAHLIELSTPPKIESVVTTRYIQSGSVQAYWSSRINLSGRQITRSRNRYLLGRVLASIIKIFIKGLPWDTQSGFKLFRNDDNFKNTIAVPFSCKWLFDIELLLRLQKLENSEYKVWEEPVSSWHDVPGSKVTWTQYLTIMGDLLKIISRKKFGKV